MSILSELSGDEIIKVLKSIVGHDGIKEYFCPAKTDGVICNYCVAKKLEI